MGLSVDPSIYIVWAMAPPLGPSPSRRRRTHLARIDNRTDTVSSAALPPGADGSGAAVRAVDFPLRDRREGYSTGSLTTLRGLHF